MKRPWLLNIMLNIWHLPSPFQEINGVLIFQMHNGVPEPSAIASSPFYIVAKFSIFSLYVNLIVIRIKYNGVLIFQMHNGDP
jgi:hypothetical protein